MKELIYLDKNFLHSFIAQTNDGLITSKNSEFQEQRTETHQESKGAQARGYFEVQGDTGKFDIPFVIKSPSAKATLRLAPGENHSESFTIADLEAGKEIISTQLHDNALNDFEKHFEEKGLIKVIENSFSTPTLPPGTYIKTTSSFTAMNFEVIEKIVGEKFLEISQLGFKEQKDKSIQEIENENNIKPAQKKAAIKAINEQFEKIQEAQSSPIKQIKIMLEYINQTVPANAFLKMGKIFIPLKQDFLRESIDELTFKYGQNNPSIKATLIGKITRKISHNEAELPDFSNVMSHNPHSVFNSILGLPLGVLGTFNILTADDIVVSPVAIYFE
ncbi:MULTISPECIES: DUF6414 family protein [Bacillus cereus group]|uniref:DUF6414 family protein n=1 Tax=Bacillus cereus group TaxID=86661 RepID=UPI000BF6EB96|nr:MULTISPECIES: hypothetical protein [Bacillus cereus group]MDA1758535.1 hypothetical protein [Bacillus cereus]PES36684.1 hypothetical protein CN499_32285 [Bacillus thuringiensis]PFE13359.1 hypothetical protein CN304_26545 [Bacillus thuringiensis]PFU99561.1 hypothetical protein COK93_08905 [Bacillus thuringiensis]QUW30221.1 hypothetical protein J8Y17_18850 [Bacillus cereus]